MIQSGWKFEEFTCLSESNGWTNITVVNFVYTVREN